MKKYLLIFLILITTSSFILSGETKKSLSLDLPISKVAEDFGDPIEIHLEEFPTNQNWDLIWYCYNSLEIGFYRSVEKINSIKSYSNKYEIEINNKKISCGYKKTAIEKIFGKGSFEKTSKDGNYYYYPLTDFREIEILYDKKNIACEIIYRYSDPE